MTISTHKGLFRYNLLPFGIAAASTIFQRTMEGILQGIPRIWVYIDDTLIADSLIKRRSHGNFGESPISSAAGCGKIKEGKMQIHNAQCDSTSQGRESDQHKAILNAPAPCDVTQLKSFIGLVYYYSKFLPCLADIWHHCTSYWLNVSHGTGERNRLRHFRKQSLMFYWCT